VISAPTLRHAVPADADAIAALHVDVWRATYRDLAPEAAIRALDVPLRRARWIETLAAPKPDQIALVAESGGRLAGFGLAGPAGDASFGERGEIKFLYVARDFQRHRIGRRLISAMARHLAERGYDGVGLSVVIGNDAAIAFYEGLGGRSIGTFTDPGPLWRSANFIYVWDDLPALAARATPDRH
jgi:ribosomal protein S18 acetylase RimI-like enzyme